MLEQLEKLQNYQAKLEKSIFFVEAAVFVPFIQTENGFELLFEVRAAHLTRQPGEICFPGGKVDKRDKSVVETALRETQEELGLTSSDLRVFGQLDYFSSPLGLYIYPVCGEITAPQNISPNSQEVAEVFTVPLQWFIDNPPQVSTMYVGTQPAPDFPFHLFENKSHQWQLRAQHEVLFYHYQEYLIWGLTAQVIDSLLKQLNLV